MTLLRRGQLIAVPAAGEGDGLPGPARVSRRAEPRGAAGRSSAPRRQVRAGIESVAQEYGAEEVIVVTITYDHGARRRSYELLAEAMGLEPASHSHSHEPPDRPRPVHAARAVGSLCHDLPT